MEQEIGVSDNDCDARKDRKMSKEMCKKIPGQELCEKILGPEVCKAITNQVAMVAYYRGKCIEMGMGENDATRTAIEYQAQCLAMSYNTRDAVNTAAKTGEGINLEKMTENLVHELKKIDRKKMN